MVFAWSIQTVEMKEKAQVDFRSDNDDGRRVKGRSSGDLAEWNAFSDVEIDSGEMEADSKR
jgi:hypothetical protein